MASECFRELAAYLRAVARFGVALRATALDLQDLSLALLTKAKSRLPPGQMVATNAVSREAGPGDAPPDEPALDAPTAPLEAAAKRLIAAADADQRAAAAA
jgi:hypothetical protein